MKIACWMPWRLRANAPQKAATGAILRVIRDLLGIKGTYSIDELKKPFAVARTSFSPDYNDPVIKQMMLQQAMQSVGNLFGNVQPVIQTISIPTSTDDEIDIPADPIYEGNVQEKSKVSTGNQKPDKEDRTMDFRCDKCDELIPQKVWDYSVEHYDRPLCYKCQKIVRSERR